MKCLKKSFHGIEKRFMKKTAALILTLSLFISCLPILNISVSAYGGEVYNSGDYSYWLDDNNNALIQSYNGSDSNVVVPSSIDGHPVIDIKAAFSPSSNIISVTFPDTLICVGDFTFADCTTLKEVTIPNSVTKIGKNVFNGCTNLEKIYMSDNIVSIGWKAFYNCSSITNIDIPSALISIGTGAFTGCTSLKTVNVHDISDWVKIHFADKEANPLYYSGALCVNNIPITKLTIPAGVTELLHYAFIGFDELTSLTANEGLKSIGPNCFSNCSKLEEINLPDSVSTLGEEAFSYCTALKSVRIPKSVANVTKNAFYNDSALATLTFSSNVTIGEEAFEGCNIENLIIEESVDTLSDDMVFSSSIKSITLPNSPIRISRNAFNKTDYYKNPENWENGMLYIGKHLIKIDSDFSGELDIKDGTVTVADYAAYDNAKLVGVTIPESCELIGSFAFAQCKDLKAVNVQSLALRGCNYSFYNSTALERVDIPNLNNWYGMEFTAVSSNPLMYAHKLYVNGELVTSLVIPEDITKIGSYAFQGCTEIKTLTLSDKERTVGENPFDGSEVETIIITEGSKKLTSSMVLAQKITKIVLPNSIKTIEDGVFQNCRYLQTVDLPDELESIGDNAFKDCIKLTEIVLPNGVTYIGNSAFENCTGLTEIVFPNGVTAIGNSAFQGCTGLTEIVLSDALKTIGNNAFRECKNLKSLTLPENTESLGQYAFYLCEKLSEITIPKSLKKIGKSAFLNNPSLSKINITNIKSWCNIDFEDHYSSPVFKTEGLYLNGNLITDLEIPEGTTRIAKDAFRSNKALKTVKIPDSVTEIGNGAFASCTGLNGINLPDSITKIDSYAFASCTGIDSIDIPDGITKISDSSFAGCSSLRSVTIPYGVKSIGSCAFIDCVSLKNITIPGSVTKIGDWVFPGNENFTLMCYKDSAAHNYAVSNNINYLLIKNSVDAPSAPALETKTYNSVTLKRVAGFEYSIDGINWYSNNIFKNLKPETEYTFYQRTAETETSYASESSTALKVKTKEQPPKESLSKENGVWYYVVYGEKVNATTLVKYNGSWFYVENGKVNFKATTLCKYYNTWYYVEKGKVNFNVTTLCKYYNTWYYVEKGKVNFNATTLCKYYNTWYYVEKGKVNFNATTLCKYYNIWYYVEKGKVNFNATTLCKYGNTWYYVEKGKVNRNANKRCLYNGIWYSVRDGIVR